MKLQKETWEEKEAREIREEEARVIACPFNFFRPCLKRGCMMWRNKGRGWGVCQMTSKRAINVNVESDKARHVPFDDY